MHFLGSFCHGVVEFLTLIKKDGEALGVRSSNESMFTWLTQGKQLRVEGEGAIAAGGGPCTGL